MTRKTYIPSINDGSIKMCKLLTRARPVIERLYSNNPALIAALNAASSACEVLVSESTKVREYEE